MIPRPERRILSPKGERLDLRGSWFLPTSLLDPKTPLFEYALDLSGDKVCFWFDAEEAERWVNFPKNNCVFIEGDAELVGQPIDFLDWQKEITRELFGWKCVINGELTDVRRYQQCNIIIPKKNNKTTGGVIWSLALAELDNHQQSQNFYSAYTEEQGEDAGWRIITAMVKHESEHNKLKDRYVAWDTVIDHTPSDSVIRLLSGSTGAGKAGKNVHSAVIDEYWEFKDKKAVKQLRTGMVNQKNPMLIFISTAGDDMTVPAYKDYEIAKKIMKGEINNPYYLAQIFEPPEGANWHDRKIWQMVNPGWGVTVNERTLEQIYYESLGSPTDEAEFQQFHIGMWVSGAVDYIAEPEWRKCKAEFTMEELVGRDCFFGLDLSKNRDLSALSAVFPMWSKNFQKEDLLIFQILTWFWCDEDSIYNYVGETEDEEQIKKEKERQKATGNLYPEWVERGLLRKTKGNVVDQKTIRLDIKAIADQLQIKKAKRKLFYDRYLMGTETMTALEGEDFGFEIFEVAQTIPGIGGTTDEFERLVLNRQIRHNDHDILNWNVRNAKCVKDNKGGRMISKTKSKGKIDGLAATLNAMKGALASPPPKKRLKAEVW